MEILCQIHASFVSTRRLVSGGGSRTNISTIPGLGTRFPGRFIPRERAPGTLWIGGWVGPRARLDVVE
jgi:hypothetical protein